MMLCRSSGVSFMGFPTFLLIYAIIFVFKKNIAHIVWKVNQYFQKCKMDFVGNIIENGKIQ